MLQYEKSVVCTHIFVTYYYTYCSVQSTERVKQFMQLHAGTFVQQAGAVTGSSNVRSCWYVLSLLVLSLPLLATEELQYCTGYLGLRLLVRSPNYFSVTQGSNKLAVCCTSRRFLVLNLSNQVWSYSVKQMLISTQGYCLVCTFCHQVQ